LTARSRFLALTVVIDTGGDALEAAWAGALAAPVAALLPGAAPAAAPGLSEQPQRARLASTASVPTATDCERENFMAHDKTSQLARYCAILSALQICGKSAGHPQLTSVLGP